MYPIPRTVLTNPAYSALLDAVDSVLITTEELADRWRLSVSHLTNLRQAQRGPASIKLATGAVRYKLAEVLAHEKHGECAQVTFDRLAFALSTVPGLDPAMRGRIENHLRDTVFKRAEGS